LKSELDEDPLFDDDWDASVFLYPRSKSPKAHARPPVTLLVMAVLDNIIFDPSKEELSVAEVVLAVSVAEKSSGAQDSGGDEAMGVDVKPSRDIRLLSVRTIDPPSRLTPPGIPNFLNTATGGPAPTSSQRTEVAETEGVWQPLRGGAKRKTIATMIQKVIEKGGVAEEVLDGLDAVDLG
jgi:exosome complex component RRP42